METIKFDKDTHTYSVGDNTLISVTQLMSKFNLSPSYEFVNKELLEKSANRGTLIHKAIENIIKGETSDDDAEFFEVDQFNDYINSCEYPISDMKSETIVNNEHIAGTIDFIFNQHNKTVIADFKTTSTIHRNAVAWQLSLYAYLYDKEHYNDFLLQVWHFSPSLRIVPLQLKPMSEVERLIQCYIDKKPFEEKNEFLPEELKNELYAVETQLFKFEKLLKELKEKEKELFTKIKDAMEEHGVSNCSTDNLTLTYVAPTTRTDLDKKKLKEDHPKIYDQYIKTTQVNSCIKVKLKGE